SSFYYSPTSVIYTLSLHDALPISFLETLNRILALFYLLAHNLRGLYVAEFGFRPGFCNRGVFQRRLEHAQNPEFLRVFGTHRLLDRKSTRLNSSHRTISYAVFCLK